MLPVQLYGIITSILVRYVLLRRARGGATDSLRQPETASAERVAAEEDLAPAGIPCLLYCTESHNYTMTRRRCGRR